MPLLSAADVFLLPSAQESFGLAALEAMACGVPVVASRVGGMPEVVEDGVTGFLHAADDLDGMAAVRGRNDWRMPSSTAASRRPPAAPRSSGSATARSSRCTSPTTKTRSSHRHAPDWPCCGADSALLARFRFGRLGSGRPNTAEKLHLTADAAERRAPPGHPFAQGILADWRTIRGLLDDSRLDPERRAAARRIADSSCSVPVDHRFHRRDLVDSPVGRLAGCDGNGHERRYRRRARNRYER